MLIKWKSYRSNLFGFIAAQTTCFEFKQLSTSLLTLVNTTQAACTYQWKFFLELCHKITPKVYNLRNFFFKFLTFLRLWNTSAYINASWLIAPLVLTTFCGPDRLASTLPSSGPISVLTWLLPKLMPKSITAVQRNRACRLCGDDCRCQWTSWLKYVPAIILDIQEEGLRKKKKEE